MVSVAAAETRRGRDGDALLPLFTFVFGDISSFPPHTNKP